MLFGPQQQCLSRASSSLNLVCKLNKQSNDLMILCFSLSKKLLEQSNSAIFSRMACFMTMHCIIQSGVSLKFGQKLIFWPFFGTLYQIDGHCTLCGHNLRFAFAHFFESRAQFVNRSHRFWRTRALLLLNRSSSYATHTMHSIKKKVSYWHIHRLGPSATWKRLMSIGGHLNGGPIYWKIQFQPYCDEHWRAFPTAVEGSPLMTDCNFQNELHSVPPITNANQGTIIRIISHSEVRNFIKFQ